MKTRQLKVGLLVLGVNFQKGNRKGTKNLKITDEINLNSHTYGVVNLDMASRVVSERVEKKMQTFFLTGVVYVEKNFKSKLVRLILYEVFAEGGTQRPKKKGHVSLTNCVVWRAGCVFQYRSISCTVESVGRG